MFAKTRCNAGWLVSKGGGFAPLAIVGGLWGGRGARGVPEDWRGGGVHIRPYIGGGTGGAELGDQRRIVTGRLRPAAVIARAPPSYRDYLCPNTCFGLPSRV